MDKTDGSSTRLLSKTIIPFQVQWVVTALWLVVGRGKTNVDNLYYYHANMAKPKISNVDVGRQFPLAHQPSISGVSYLFELLFFIYFRLDTQSAVTVSTSL